MRWPCLLKTSSSACWIILKGSVASLEEVGHQRKSFRDLPFPGSSFLPLLCLPEMISLWHMFSQPWCSVSWQVQNEQSREPFCETVTPKYASPPWACCLVVLSCPPQIWHGILVLDIWRCSISVVEWILCYTSLEECAKSWCHILLRLLAKVKCSRHCGMFFSVYAII